MNRKSDIFKEITPTLTFPGVQRTVQGTPTDSFHGRRRYRPEETHHKSQPTTNVIKMEQSKSSFATYWVDFESPAEAGDLQGRAVDRVSSLPQGAAKHKNTF